MNKTRLEAFSDGVFAIVITIMVLELKVPHGDTLEALHDRWPVFLSYVLSFTGIGIYWNNHHHMLHLAKRINGWVLWANLHLLFWLSLVPATTAWIGDTHFALWPVVVYTVVSLMSGAAYVVLAQTLLRSHGADSEFAAALGRDAKGVISLIVYAAAIGLAFIHPGLAMVANASVALIWLIPDRRFVH